MANAPLWGVNSKPHPLGGVVYFSIMAGDADNGGNMNVQRANGLDLDHGMNLKWDQWLAGVTIQELFSDATPRPIDMLLWIGGSFPQIEVELEKTFDSIFNLKDLVHVTVLMDGLEVSYWSPVDYYLPLMPSRSLITSPTALSLPSVLYNFGMFRSRSPWLAFAWAGVQPTLDGLSGLLANSKDSLLIYGSLPESDLAQPEMRLDSWRPIRINGQLHPSQFAHHPMPHGWLQMVAGIPMANCLLATRAREIIGGFDHRALLQSEFWWDYTRRFSRYHQSQGMPLPAPKVTWTWSDYPFVQRVYADPDLGARFMSDEMRRTLHLEEQNAYPPDDIAHLRFDLGTAEVNRLTHRLSRWRSACGLAEEQETTAPFVRPQAGAWPLRVTVVGGINEPPHSQICFYSPFQNLLGQGYLTWRPILDSYVLAADLMASDLVIFVRPRSNEARAALDYCMDNRIPTLAMFDDNWLTLARERPEYTSLFSPGQPDYENFIYACQNADLTVTYNKRMETDLSPYCRNLLRISPPVDVKVFEGTRKKRCQDGRLIIGYAGGGLRDHKSAFQGLVRFILEEKAAQVFIMGHVLPPELATLPADRVLFVPYEYNFFRYAEVLRQVRPDIMLAPLGETDTDKSKCARKYFDAASVGSPGIYSDVETYNTLIRHGETGLLVSDNEEKWYEAICTLVKDPLLRIQIADSAKKAVASQYSVEVLIPELLEALQKALSIARGRFK